MKMLKKCGLNSKILIFLLIFTTLQKTQANDLLKSSNKRPNQNRASDLTTTPSPEWLEYQRERFSNTKDVESLKKMLDPASQLLKNQREKIIPPVGEQSKKDVETTSDDGREHDDEGDDEMRSKEGNTNLLTFPITNIQYPSLRGFIGFLKRLKRSWFKHSTMTIEQKISDLKRLKTKLMFIIEDRFNMIWAPKEYARRKKRGLLEESNLQFPPEAALISINFLTFAVFLIKLVLQVVHVIKSKHYKLSGLGFGFTDTDAMTKAA